MLWVKAFHIVAVVCWFSGLFYLPRLFVYHAMSDDQVSKDRFVIMERKLFWGITTPSAVSFSDSPSGYFSSTSSRWRCSRCPSTAARWKGI